MLTEYNTGTKTESSVPFQAFLDSLNPCTCFCFLALASSDDGQHLASGNKCFSTNVDLRVVAGLVLCLTVVVDVVVAVLFTIIQTKQKILSIKRNNNKD